MESIEENVVSVSNELNDKDPYALRVRGGDPLSPDPTKRPTDPVGLSRSILHVLSENAQGYCKLNSVGATALYTSMTAFRLASTAYSHRTKGTVLVMTQSEYSAVVAGNKTRGICTRIFPIPVTSQL